jgi:hypothetical protein
MALDILEADFLGDLSADTHGIWEIFAFVRLHYPGLDDSKLCVIGEAYLTRWIEEDWIAVADKPLYPTQVKSLAEISAFVRKHAPFASGYIEGAPSLDITEAGSRALLKTNRFRSEVQRSESVDGGK